MYNATVSQRVKRFICKIHLVLLEFPFAAELEGKMSRSTGADGVSKEWLSFASCACVVSLAEFAVGSNSCAPRANQHPRASRCAASRRVDFVVYYFRREFATRPRREPSGAIFGRSAILPKGTSSCKGVRVRCNAKSASLAHVRRTEAAHFCNSLTFGGSLDSRPVREPLNTARLLTCVIIVA